MSLHEPEVRYVRGGCWYTNTTRALNRDYCGARLVDNLQGFRTFLRVRQSRDDLRTP